VSPQKLPLGDNRVEVKLEAAGVNFKDLAITMGIVPENEFLLGLEGAGTICRAGSTSYRVGQRVLVFEKGTYANRIIATTERIYPIPDSMTYEEASTLASVYLTALYSLHDLADTRAGQVRITPVFIYRTEAHALWPSVFSFIRRPVAWEMRASRYASTLERRYLPQLEPKKSGNS
jgi:D-arabinose 1-dehydrogenase-like Zn-dependent alcohol dehydrogenase